MIIDLITLSIIGAITEFFAFNILSFFLYFAIPLYFVSPLFISLAVARWGKYGLILTISQTLVTFFVLRNVLPDIEVELAETTKTIIRHEFFNLTVLLLIFLSNCSGALSLLFRKAYKRKEVPKYSIGYFILVGLAPAIVGTIVSYIMYQILKTDNLIEISETLIIYSLLPIIITALAGLVISSNGLYIDQKFKILFEKRERELLEENEKKYFEEN